MDKTAQPTETTDERPDDEPAIRTTVRCFRRLREGEEQERRGIWLMTRPSGPRGVFFHGDREEAQPSRYNVGTLTKWAREGGGPLHVEEIPPEDALIELESWSAAREDAIAIFERHPKP